MESTKQTTVELAKTIKLLVRVAITLRLLESSIAQDCPPNRQGSLSVKTQRVSQQPTFSLPAILCTWLAFRITHQAQIALSHQVYTSSNLKSSFARSLRVLSKEGNSIRGCGRFRTPSTAWYGFHRFVSDHRKFSTLPCSSHLKPISGSATQDQLAVVSHMADQTLLQFS